MGNTPHLFECCFIVGTTVVDIVIKVQTVCYILSSSYVIYSCILYTCVINIELLWLSLPPPPLSLSLSLFLSLSLSPLSLPLSPSPSPSLPPSPLSSLSLSPLSLFLGLTNYSYFKQCGSSWWYCSSSCSLLL